MSSGNPFHDRVIRHSRLGRPGVAVLALTVAMCLLGLRNHHSALAEQAPQDVTGTAAAPGTADGSPKEVQTLLTELADIDTMHALAPLKLNSDEAGDLADMINNARKAYDAKVNAMGSAPLIKMADEIHATRKSVIAGKEVPKDFDERVKQIESDFTRKRDQINTANIISIAAASKKILTSNQVSTAAALERHVLDEAGKLAQGTTDAELFNAFVVDVFIQNPRTPTILQEMKTVLH